MELFLLLSDLQSKDLFYKKFLPFKNESKLVLKTGNGIISSLLLMCSDVLTGVGTPHLKCIQLFTAPHKISNLCNGTDGWVTIRRIMPLRGSILQVWTCQILSLAENPRWSRVWQKKTYNSTCRSSTYYLSAGQKCTQMIIIGWGHGT